jgi:hypothetical protein
MSQDTEDSYNVNDFLYNWNAFIKKYRYEFPTNLLSKYGFKNFDLEDLTRVVISATKGEQDGLHRLDNVRKYLRATMNDIKENFHGYDDEYEEIDETIEDFEEMLGDLDPEVFTNIINLAKPEEKIMVRSIGRQASVKLPEDVQKEIISHIGIGGIRRKKSKSKRRKSKNNSKKSRKTKTKRKIYRVHSRRNK